MIRSLSTILLILLFVAVPSGPTMHAQDGDSCQALVTEAMQVVGSSCSMVGRDQVCYGHTAVNATLRNDAPFADSGDVVDVLDLEALFTAAYDPDSGAWGVALMNLGLELETGLMTMVLMGDTQVTPTQEAGPTCAVTNPSANNINVRGGPGTNFDIVDVFATDASGVVDGRNDAGDWVRAENGWLFASLVEVDCAVDTLPVVEGMASAAPPPMSVFTLQTGAATACETAPNGLLVESPTGERATITINGVQLVFSSAAFITAVPDDALVVRGRAGQVEVTADGQTVTVLPDTEARVPLSGLEAAGPPQAPASVPTDAPTIPELPPPPLMLTVPGTVGGGNWWESGLTIHAGQTFTFSASGQVNLAVGCPDLVDQMPELDCDSFITGPTGGPLIGLDEAETQARMPFPDQMPGALMGRIGEGDPFLVGEGVTVTAQNDGLLQFTINDDGPEDNAGDFTVMVQFQG